MTETGIQTVDVAEIQERHQPLIDWANALMVDCNDILLQAETQVGAIDAARKRLGDELRPGINAAHKTHKILTTQFNDLDMPLAEARRIAKNKTSNFRMKLERERRQQEVEMRAKAFKEEEERRLEQAAQLEAQGHTEAAEAVIDKPIEAPPIVVAPLAPTAEVRYTTTWKARVMAKAEIPLEFMQPDMVRLGQIARSLKEDAKVAGVEFYSVRT